MGTTSKERSLMEFNRRVLFQGKIPQDEINRRYTADELQPMVFFNRIFLTNTEEMISKYDVSEILAEYNDMIDQYFQNIRLIVERFNDAYPESKYFMFLDFGVVDDAPRRVIRDRIDWWKFVREQLECVDRFYHTVREKCKTEYQEVQKCPAITFDDVFDHDIMLEYPRDSFNSYLQILRLAAQDPNVQKISITLYRIGDDPTIVGILTDAVNRGIDVHVNIELYARGDEVQNLKWKHVMENLGIHVTAIPKYVNIKVHCKLTLIEFVNGRTIVQIGTGNYHSKTVTQYTDLSLITSREEVGNGAKQIFALLRQYNGSSDNIKNEPFMLQAKRLDIGKDLIVAPINIRNRMASLVQKEAKKGSNGYIAIKCNSLDDPLMINLLESAALHGCKIDLIVRGICTWVPSGDMDVKIRSIIWDKLEHSRVYCFGRENPQIFIGSLDPVKHKIERRIETLVRVRDPDLLFELCEYMNRHITNCENSWIQLESGIYVKEK